RPRNSGRQRPLHPRRHLRPDQRRRNVLSPLARHPTQSRATPHRHRFPERSHPAPRSTSDRGAFTKFNRAKIRAIALQSAAEESLCTGKSRCCILVSPFSTAMDVSGHIGAILNQKDGKRSEEHTSELQSQSNLVCRLLLEKKN